MVAATMVRNPIDIWFDFIDPASVLLLLDIHAGGDEGPEWVRESEFRWRPYELRPPPTPLVGIDHPDIAPAWAAARPTAADSGLVVDGVVTDAGLDELRSKMPHADVDSFASDPRVENIQNLFTVDMIVNFIERKLAN